MISRNKQSGLMTIDAALWLILLSVVLGLVSMWMLKAQDMQDYRITADQQRIVAEALSKYLKDNYAIILNNATPTSPVQITVPMLRNTGYLPDSYSETNMFGQTILGLVRRPNPNQLEAVVITTGGQAIPELGIRSIAEHLGGPGGYISNTDTNTIQGIRGGWQVALSNYGISPGAGHTASALFLMDGELANDYLYRNEVPGRPELNTMNTAIDMNEHDIKNAKRVEASDWFRSHGDTGWYSETWGGGIHQTDEDWVRTFGEDVGFSTEGRLRTAEYLEIDSVVVADTACPKAGLISANADGLTLSCQSASTPGQLRWASNGGGGQVVGGWTMDNAYPYPYCDYNGCYPNATTLSCTSAWGKATRTRSSTVNTSLHWCGCPANSTAVINEISGSINYYLCYTNP